MGGNRNDRTLRQSTHIAVIYGISGTMAIGIGENIFLPG